MAWSNRGLARHESGDYRGAIADYTAAIELTPDSAFMWNNQGFAKYHLGQNEEAITDYKEAIRLNPKNKTVISNLQAAEIALISHKKADETFKDEEEHHKRLKKRAEEHKQHYEALIKERKALFNSIRWIIIIFIVLFGIFFYCYVYGGSDFALRQAIGELNFFTLWPYYMFMFVSLMPSVVMLRLNIQDAKRELILKEDFEGRYIVELYLERFFSSEPDHRKFAEKYISYWMHNNPSETLLRLDKKSSDQSDAAHIDIIRELIRNQKPPS